MPPSRPTPRNPTEKADEFARVIKAVIDDGGIRKAAKTTGVPASTVSLWWRSKRGQDEAARYRAKAQSGGHVAKLERVLDKLIARAEEKIDAGESAKDEAITYGIFSDKYARLVGPKPNEQQGQKIYVVEGFSVSAAPTIDAKALPLKSRKPPKKSSDEPAADDEDDEP